MGFFLLEQSPQGPCLAMKASQNARSGIIDSPAELLVLSEGEGDEQGRWWNHVSSVASGILRMTTDNNVIGSGQYEVVRSTNSDRSRDGGDGQERAN